MAIERESEGAMIVQVGLDEVVRRPAIAANTKDEHPPRGGRHDTRGDVVRSVFDRHDELPPIRREGNLRGIEQGVGAQSALVRGEPAGRARDRGSRSPGCSTGIP